METTWAKIVAKCWSDPEFKQQLMQNPEGVLRSHGIAIPEGKQITICEQTASHEYLFLPKPPADVDLSAEELENIAAGTPVGCQSRLD